MKLKRINYRRFKKSQKMAYNFTKFSAILADYGFTPSWRSSDLQRGNIIARHIDGKHRIRVQLTTRMTFWKKLIGKNMNVAFFAAGHWYLYPHDKLLREATAVKNIKQTAAWKKTGLYNFHPLTKYARLLLEKYILP